MLLRISKSKDEETNKQTKGIDLLDFCYYWWTSSTSKKTWNTRTSNIQKTQFTESVTMRFMHDFVRHRRECFDGG